MRYFRRLPPLLRVASLVGLLLPLASIVLLLGLVIALLTSSFLQLRLDAFRVLAIGLNLGMLGGACSFGVNTYSMRFRRPDRGPFPLDSWQSQGRAIGLLAALPLGALALAVVIPSNLSWFFTVFPISVIAVFVLLAASVYANIRWRALD